MLVCLNKFFVEYFLPLCMKQLPMTVRKEGITGLLILGMIKHKVFEVIRELTEMSVIEPLPAQR